MSEEEVVADETREELRSVVAVEAMTRAAIELGAAIEIWTPAVDDSKILFVSIKVVVARSLLLSVAAAAALAADAPHAVAAAFVVDCQVASVRWADASGNIVGGDVDRDDAILASMNVSAADALAVVLAAVAASAPAVVVLVVVAAAATVSPADVAVVAASANVVFASEPAVVGVGGTVEAGAVDRVDVVVTVVGADQIGLVDVVVVVVEGVDDVDNVLVFW